MFNFLKIFLIFFIISETTLLLWFFFDNEISSYEYFLGEFFFFLSLNYYINYEKNTVKLDIDILFKYLVLFFKTPSYFLNYFLNIFKKIFTFLYYYKYRHFLNTIRVYSRKHFYKYFIIWRPLFKKTSYFGYYRSNRSKWIK